MSFFDALSENDFFKGMFEDVQPSIAIAHERGTCASHNLGWCKAVPGKAFYNIEFLAKCPLEPNDDSN